MIDTGTMPSGRFESAHWQSGIERSSTATPGSILVEIHSSRMDASREVIEDGESIFIVFMCYCSLFRNRAAKLRRFMHMTYILSVCRPMIYVYLWIILEVSMIFILGLFLLFRSCLIARQRYNEKWEPILLVPIFPCLWPENSFFGFISRRNRTNK